MEAIIAGMWKMQASNMGSRKVKTNRWIKKITSDNVNITAAVIRHNFDSDETLSDKIFSRD